MSRSDLIDVVVELEHETDAAILVRDHPDNKPTWLPRSQIEIEKKPGGVLIVTLPEWLAEKKGLV